ncbi:MAG: hypothetical protein J6S67_11655 [Methanobrevibacter sp.]|nr:hypothetical protein [Methanobrevibacter sp.]
MYNFTSFDAFVGTTNGRYIGNHTSKDYINLLWEYLGSVYYTSNPSDPSPTSGAVKNGWINTSARSANTINHLTQVPSRFNIKRGDIVVFNYGINGIAGFSNEDFRGSNLIYIYAQGLNGVNKVSLSYIDLNSTAYIGGWRYDAWQQSPPTPPTPVQSEEKRRFKWALYARKLRDKRIGL